MHCPHEVAQQSTITDAGVEQAKRRRSGLNMSQLSCGPFSDFPFLITGIYKREILLPVIVETKWPTRIYRCGTV